MLIFWLLFLLTTSLSEPQKNVLQMLSDFNDASDALNAYSASMPMGVK